MLDAVRLGFGIYCAAVLNVSQRLPTGTFNALSSRAPFYVIGDIHGCAEELNELIHQLEITPETTLVVVGDYVDRGPDSRQVLELMLELSSRCQLVPLLGNHDGMFLSFLAEPLAPQSVTFIYNGGGATLASYADDEGNYRIPREHIAFLHDLKLWFETPDYFTVHAGVPDGPLESLDPSRDWEQLLWTRNMRVSKYSWSKVVVHGHTATRNVVILPNQINVDTACVFDNALSAIELPSRRVVSVKRGAGRPARLLKDNNSNRSAVRFAGTAKVRIFDKGEAYEFQTVNYSQTGMLIRWTEQGLEPHLRPDDRVGGIVGTGGHTMLAFTAAIVRTESSQDGLFCGLRLLPPYGSSELTQLAWGLAEADEMTEDRQLAGIDIKAVKP